MNNKPIRMADCHPDRKHHCKGLCKNCYKTDYNRKRRAVDADYDQSLKEYFRTAAEKRRPEYRFNRSLEYNLGITFQDYKIMLEAQGGACAICRVDKPLHNRLYFCVDHDHVSGKIRGLLCDDCNLAAGKLKDDPTIIMRLYDYIVRGEYVGE